MRRDVVAPSFSFVRTFVASNFVNDFGIDFHGFGIILGKVFLLMYFPFSRPVFEDFLTELHLCLLSFFFGEP